MTTPNTQAQESELNPIEAIKRAIGLATFANSTEVGGIVFKLLDSLSQDLTFAGAEFSDRTEDYTQELVDCLAEDISEYATELEDEDDAEEEEEEEEISGDLVIATALEDEDEDEILEEVDDDLSDEDEDNFMEDSADEPEDEDENGVSSEREGATN